MIDGANVALAIKTEDNKAKLSNIQMIANKLESLKINNYVILCDKAFTQLTPRLLKKIRKIFLLPEVNNSIGTLCWNPPNKVQVIDLLCKDHHLNLERVSNNVDKVIKNFYICRKFFKNRNNNSSLVQTTLI